MEEEGGLTPGPDRVFFTGSGAGFIAPAGRRQDHPGGGGGRRGVEKLHPDVRFVSEIGGEDMKTIFFTASGTGKSKQVYMQSACSGGTGTFIEKTARKLQMPERAAGRHALRGHEPAQDLEQCGIFAETDANTLLKTGVPVEEIIASLFEAVVYQNLATLTKGNTPMPRGAAARRPEPVLQGAAGGMAPSPRQAVDRAEGRAAGGRATRPRCIIVPTTRSTTPPGLRRDRQGREARGRRLSGPREARLVDRGRPARGEGEGGRQGADQQPG